MGNGLLRRWLTLALIVGLAACHEPTGEPPVDGVQDLRPNIILILTDDQDVATLPFMPILQRELVAEGTTFANFFATTSICCPSRVSILRGQYVHNHGVRYNSSTSGGGWLETRRLGLEASTVATWLQGGGYRTGFMGKYLNGYLQNQPDSGAYVPVGWHEWLGNSGGYFEPFVGNDGELVSFGEWGDPAAYQTDIMTRRALEFIRQEDDRPYFLFISTYAPHNRGYPRGHGRPGGDPPVPATRHRGLFSDRSPAEPPSFMEEDVSDKPPTIRARSGSGTAQRRNDRDTYWRGRMESLMAVDELIDSVVTAISDAVQWDRTFLVFTSDNGFHMGEHRLGFGKNTPYEEDIRVPMVVRGPRIPPGDTVYDFTLNIDLAPTFAELGGVVAPSFVDGRSLVPLFAHSAGWPRIRFLTEHWNTDLGIEAVGLRERGVGYTEWNDGGIELYDLIGDPFQLQSLHDSVPAFVLDEHSNLMKEMVACRGLLCRVLDSRP